MADIRTQVDDWEVKDLEDNATYRIYVEHCTEMGNKGVPGIMVKYMGRIVNFEPLHVERWAYQAQKGGQETYLLESESWTHYDDLYVKVYLVCSNPPKARVEVKVRSKKAPVAKEYELPFRLEE